MFKKQDDKLYLKYKNVNYAGYISAIVSLILLCVFIIRYFDRLNSNYKWVNMFLQSGFTRILLITGIMVFILISITNILFYSNYDYHINKKTKSIHLINGRWKFREEIVIGFSQIKNIVLIRCAETAADYGKTYIYKIDIYDNELNAYEIYDSKNYDIMNNLATGIGKIVKSEVIDRTDIENYEGFKKRIL
jgi:hypothetical protein